MQNNPVLDERDKKHSLAALSQTDGGKVIIESLKSDIKRYVAQLSSEYRTATHFDLVRICAELNASFSLYQALTMAENHVKVLDEILEETLHD